jgi:hypothetical protein
MDELIVNWEGPLALDEACMRKHPNDDFGLYQVYGRYLVSEEHALLYFGKAERQTFGARFAQHRKNWLHREESVEIHLGKLDPSCFKGKTVDPSWSDWAEKLAQSEALTVAVHTPPYNSHYIIGYGGGAVRIVNRGERGRLRETYDSAGPVPRIGPSFVRGPRLVIPGSPYETDAGDIGWRESCRKVAASHFASPAFPTDTPVKIVARFFLPEKARVGDLGNATKLLIDGLGAGGLFTRRNGTSGSFDAENHLVQRIDAEKRIDPNPRVEVEIWIAKT